MPKEEAKEPGPTDVTLEEAMNSLTEMYGQAAQQLAIAQVKVHKQSILIAQLQSELAKKAPAHDEAA